jgi:hypothetical protein
LTPRAELLALAVSYRHSTARHTGQELATLNIKHFPMFAGLEPPFRL